MRTIVMKFGGASVDSPESFLHIADIIAARRKSYSNVVVVVSAMGDTTNQLLSLARKVHPDPPKREEDMLVSAGERMSSALLAMALKRKGFDALSFTGSQVGIVTSAKHADARILDVRPFRLFAPLRQGKVVIVAGFQGVGLDGGITTLGRGGSDTTAVALAAALQAQKVEFFKDVKGVFSTDPKMDPSAKFHEHLSYEEARAIVQKGSCILHERAIDLAAKAGICLRVLSYKQSVDSDEGTTIGFSSIDHEELPNPSFSKTKGQGYEALFQQEVKEVFSGV